MYDRAILIAKANGFKYVDLFLYHSNDDSSAFGLKIQPWLNHGVSIQVKEESMPLEESEPIILSPLDSALLEPIIKAIAFANLATIRRLTP
jgi:hypothetical protein